MRMAATDSPPKRPLIEDAQDEGAPPEKKPHLLEPPLRYPLSQWYPTRYLAPDSSPPPFALLILNVPLQHEPLPSLISKASFIICADGGANRLHEAQSHSKHPDAGSWLPDVILGDLDSLHGSVRTHYESQGVTIIHKSDQYSTDLTKCLEHIANLPKHSPSHRAGAPPLARSRQDVVILGDLGGRIDQAFATLQPLIKAAQPNSSLPNGQIFLLTPQSIAFMLRPGENEIHAPLSEGLLTENVGIIPLGGTFSVSTRGLEWDVADWKTSLGGNVSTSNHIRDDTVHVDVTAINNDKDDDEDEDGSRGAVMFTLEIAEAKHAAQE